MKKKIAVGLLAVGAIIGLASCGEAHTHDFAEGWSNDAVGHWHACTCDERLKDSFAAHVDENVDGKCDVCTYAVPVPETHEHTFATEWSKDASGHWYDSKCDHKVTSAFAVHTAGTDGKCTACGYVVNPEENVATLTAIDVNADAAKVYYNVGDSISLAGVKVYESYDNSIDADSISAVTDLSGYAVKVYDADNNEVTGAFAAFGTYKVVVSKGEVSDSYDVTVGAKVYGSVADALEAGLANSNKVSDGYISVSIDDYSQEYLYAFGDNYTQIIQGTDEYHYEVLADGSIFGVNCYIDYAGDSYVSYINEPGEENLLGVDFSTVFGYEYSPFGVDEMLIQLMELAKSEDAKNYAESFSDYCSICGNYKSYTLTFEIVLGEYFPANYEYDVKFFIDDNTNAISSIYMEISSTDYVYDSETESYVPNTEATEPDTVKVVNIEQNMGERNIENVHSASVYQFSSFALSDDSGNEIANNSTISGMVGQKSNLYLSDVAPITANANVDSIDVVITDEDGNLTWSAGGYYDNEECYIVIYSYKVGKFNVSISTANVTYNFVFDVDNAEITDFAPGLYDEFGELYEAYSGSTYVDNMLMFSAVVNAGANNAFTATLAVESENATLEASGSDYIFSASVAGEYEINLVSSVNKDFISTLTIIVEDAPDMSGVINGTYTFDNFGSIITYVFTPENEGALNGTLVITADDTDYNFTYNYYESFNTLQVLPKEDADSACEWSVGVENYELCCLYYGFFNYGPLTKVDGSSDDEELGDGTKDSPIELTDGDFVANAPEYEYVYYTYTATTDVEITITVTSASYFFEYGTYSFDLCNWGFNNVLTQNLTAGQTLYFKIQTETGEAGKVEFTVSFGSDSNDDNTSDDVQGSGVQTDPYILTIDGSYNCNATLSDYVYYAYVAEENINVVIEVTSDDFWFEYGTFNFMLCDNVNSQNNVMNISLNAGQTLFVKVSTCVADSAVVSFTFAEASSTGDDEDVEDSSDAVQISGGFTQMMAAFIEKENVTYVTNIGGGNSSCFGIYGDGTDYFISIEFDTDLTLCAGAPMAPLTYTSGSMIPVSANDGVLFWFDNSVNLTEAVVVFTVTIYAD